MLQINQHRLLDDIAALATIVEPGTPGWTRRAFSDAYLRGRVWLRERFAAAGLETAIDAAGNLVGRRRGGAGLPPILIGSHSDTVLGGGRYDGPLGLLAALEVARTLAEGGIRLRHDLEVCDFLAEEVTLYGVSCVGSRALVGTFAGQWLERTAPDGRTLAEAMRAVGGDPTLLGDVRRPVGSIAAALELHIEQGPRLERAGAALAAVSGIVGIRRGVLQLTGQPDHAGTTPMGERRDALAAAATVISALERLARAEPDAVGTVGRLEVSPNGGNVIAGEVHLTAEVRSLHPALIERLWRALLDEADEQCAARRVTLAPLTTTNVAPAAPPTWLLETVQRVCKGLDPLALTIPSGAGHDNGHLAAIGPAAMIFVPSVDGRSHCPEEQTHPAHLTLGAQALLEAVLAVDQADPPPEL